MTCMTSCSGLRLALVALAASATLPISIRAQSVQPPTLAGLTQYTIGDPSGDETEILAEINRARANPAAEGPRLVAGNSPEDFGSSEQYQAFVSEILTSFSSYPPRPPLAFNANLNASAQAHTADMVSTGVLQHNSPDGTPYGYRIKSFGYEYPYGENCAGTPGSLAHGRYILPWSTEAGYETDLFNVVAGSIGHRLAIMEPNDVGTVEVGVAQHAFNGWNTEDFGANGTPPLLTGAVFHDDAGTGFYASGEGVASVVVTAPGASSYYAVTTGSGAYTLPLDLAPVYQPAGYIDTSGPYPVSVQPPPRSGPPPTVEVVFTDALGNVTTKTLTLTHTVGTDGGSTYLNAQYDVRYDNAEVNLIQPPTAGSNPNPSPTPTPTTTPATPQVAIAPVATTMQFVLTRTGDLSVPLSVSYAAKGSAVAGQDYVALPGVKRFKAGKGAVTIKVHSLPGARGTVKLKIISDDHSYEATAPAAAKLRLQANG